MSNNEKRKRKNPTSTTNKTSADNTFKSPTPKTTLGTTSADDDIAIVIEPPTSKNALDTTSADDDISITSKITLNTTSAKSPISKTTLDHTTSANDDISIIESLSSKNPFILDTSLLRDDSLTTTLNSTDNLLKKTSNKLNSSRLPLVNIEDPNQILANQDSNGIF